ncbi:hypothetical protein O181_000258 [Austropuccinia psidii MF-1]|uniref:Uncharacterized protein n=1 Tax=Austropuccinia psidii MF-1 TaxID=1389203 RepID=A0A9Q3B8H5_9BASI|nr:hypothetical protein [Austropuccinia psidii MF-1]
MLNTQNIQSTVSTPHNAPIPYVRSPPHDTLIEPACPSYDDFPPQSTETNSSTSLYAPTPGLNNTKKEVYYQTQTPPILVKAEQAPIHPVFSFNSQPTSTPNAELSLFSNEFCSQFYSMLQMFNSG